MGALPLNAEEFGRIPACGGDRAIRGYGPGCAGSASHPSYPLRVRGVKKTAAPVKGGGCYAETGIR
ncbi:MAG: hypothetical protein LBH57_01710, partial [Treponema sp.]|nr:hypothetical protein [Treponema sp.]